MRSLFLSPALLCALVLATAPADAASIRWAWWQTAAAFSG